METTANSPTARPWPVREWMLIAAMAALAHPAALLIGLVVLAALVVLSAWVPFVWIALPAVAFTVISAVTHRARFHGHAVRPAEEPELTILVRQAAERLDFRVPLLVRIVAEPEVAVVPTRTSGFRTFTLFLGLPLVRRLTAAELVAVVAREFAHQQHAGDRRTSLLLRARDSLVESRENRFRAPAGLVERLLRASQARTWQLALAADADAAAVAGTPAVRNALAQVGTVSAAFYLFVATWVGVLGEDGDFPEDLYEALDAALADPHVASRLAADADENPPMAAAIEPPLAARLAALPEHLGVGWDTSASVALRQLDSLRRRCVRDLVSSEEAAGELRPVRLLDIAPERFEASLREAASHLVEVTGQEFVGGAVAAAADALVDGTWMRLAQAIDPEVGRLPQPMRAGAASDVLVGCLSHVIGGMLLEAGWARVSRWTASVLVGPDGALLDVEELLELAVDTGDPTRIRELLPILTERAAR
ncbi:M48 family metallopeptidase [Micromonospora sp. NPDC050276]|uniref:M48 family metallopeptidase n=1 Tax=Micromonospora sp. NPDC050276 TaxID=3364278 RepID=UPI00378D967A